jgi:hypothetical protein
MKTTLTLFALTLTLACLGITGMVPVSAVNPEPSAHGSAQSGDLMLTVSAVKHQDGSVDGHASFRNRTANTKIDIDIDCLIVGVGIGGGMVGGDESVDAILSGIVSKSSSPDLAVGDQVAFILRDNGEGQTTQPDQFTPPGRAKGPCAVGMIGGFLNNERGNIVIKPDEPAN